MVGHPSCSHRGTQHHDFCPCKFRHALAWPVDDLDAAEASPDPDERQSAYLWRLASTCAEYQRKHPEQFADREEVAAD
jgi:hypothetical protein